MISTFSADMSKKAAFFDMSGVYVDLIDRFVTSLALLLKSSLKYPWR
jgi:hypothetical protein